MALQNQYHLTESDLNNLKEWFFRYVQSFYSSDPTIHQAIVLKEKHTLRVCNEILNIGKELDLSQNSLRLAEVMALFHDIVAFSNSPAIGLLWTQNQKTMGSWASRCLNRTRLWPH